MKKRERQKKNNHFRSFVFEQRRQENREERFAKLFFSRKGLRGSENKKQKETTETNNQKDKRNDKSKNTQIRE